MANKAKDLSSGTLVESVSASATSLKVFVGNGSNATIEGVWPATPFYITVMPPAPDAGVPNSLDSEIMQVSAVGNDGDGNVVLTVSRAQRGTTAQAFTEGAIITNASYAEDAVLNSGVKSGANNAQTELRDKDGNAIYPKVSDVESSELESIFERELRMLVPTGTAIGSSKNLNTVEFLKVGRYYCSTNATVATLTNCPTSSAFMMEVFSVLSTTIDDETTNTWCYRLRMLTTYTGETYVQQCETTGTVNVWTYHSWVRTDNIQADWNASSGLAQILNKPSLATVATSGSYNDLSNKPTIPTVNNATLTIQKNGTTVQTFTANQGSNATANITVPTSFSDLSGTVGSSQFANNTIAMGRIDWSTMVATFTATTDGAGFMEVPTSVVKPATGFILGARKHALTGAPSDDAMFVPFTNWAVDRYTLKVMFYNLTPVNNASIEVDIVYCLA